MNSVDQEIIHIPGGKEWDTLITELQTAFHLQYMNFLYVEFHLMVLDYNWPWNLKPMWREELQ